MENNKLVSIIIPCYNQAHYLPEALGSVLVQTYENWECIIVNDGSPDNTEQVALEWCNKDPRFRYIKKQNGGLSSARNFGIDTAMGKYIVVLDADDKLHSLYIAKCIQTFEDVQTCALVYSEATKFGSENCRWDLERYSYLRLLSTNMIFCSAMYKKSGWKDAGGYDEGIRFGMEDWEFWLRLLDKNSIVKQLPESLFFYRVKADSMFKKMKTEDIDFVYWKAIEKNISEYKSCYPAPQRLLMEHYWEQQKSYAQSEQKMSWIKKVMYRLFFLR